MQPEAARRMEHVMSPMIIPPPPAKPAAPKCTMKTGQAVINSATFTVGAAQLLGDPRLSLFLNGMKMMFGKQDYFGLSGLLGGLMVLASPMWGVVRLVFGGGGVVAGAVATTATGIAYTGELAAKRIVGATAPSNAQIQREDLTRRFVARMNETLQTVPYADRRYFKENINQLVVMSVLKIAYLSRTVEEDNVILVNGERFGAERIANQDATRKSYFNDICEMKMAIRSLNLSPNDDHGWDVLKRDLCAWTPENQCKMDESSQETLMLLWTSLHGFSEKLTQDDVFVRIWAESQR